MNLLNKKVGVWGYGVVGKSLVNFLQDKTKLSILEKRQFSTNEVEYFNKKKYINFGPI